MSTKKELTEKIKLITQQISGKFEEGDGDAIPSYHIKGNGDAFYFSYIDRTFIKLAKQTEVFIVSENFDNFGRCLVYTYTHELIIIDKNELQYIGYN